MTGKIFKEGKKYTFSDYFEMGHPTDEIVAALNSLTSVAGACFCQHCENSSPLL
jgi:hypothetical protein